MFGPFLTGRGFRSGCFFGFGGLGGLVSSRRNCHQ
jgi:hypothetical protein